MLNQKKKRMKLVLVVPVKMTRNHLMVETRQENLKVKLVIRISKPNLKMI